MKVSLLSHWPRWFRFLRLLRPRILSPVFPSCDAQQHSCAMVL